MTKNKISDKELIKDLKLINKELQAGKLTMAQARISINAEVVNYLRGL